MSLAQRCPLGTELRNPASPKPFDSQMVVVNAGKIPYLCLCMALVPLYSSPQRICVFSFTFPSLGLEDADFKTPQELSQAVRGSGPHHAVGELSLVFPVHAVQLTHGTLPIH
jgi:hypothetical protein